jgi:Domain of unknown function (DUF4402)
MRNSIKILVILTIVVMSGMAKAQNSASTNASATATVVIPITITKEHDMTLGKVVSAPTGGTMAIAVDGKRTFSNSNNKTSTNPDGLPAEFGVTGDASCTYSVVHNGLGTGSSQNHFFLTSGTNTMAFDLDASNASQKASGNLLTAGAGDYIVTGTLTIGNNQAAGDYTGSWSEVVAYE